MVKAVNDKIEKLEFDTIVNSEGNVLGIEPPSNSTISRTINEIVDYLESKKNKTGYLISKFGV